MAIKIYANLRDQKTPIIGSTNVTGIETVNSSKAKVFFTRFLNAESLLRIYSYVNEHIFGDRIAIKLHTGEKNGPNIIPRGWVKLLQSKIRNSKIVETNTLYEGDRYTTEDHRETLKVNGWTFCPVDIMDERGDVSLPVKNGLRLKSVSMGASIVNYDAMLVLTHFKGHAMGGFGGSMKNIAIGCASGRVGKAQIHNVEYGNVPEDFGDWPAKEMLMENMADSAKAVCDFFGKKITFINVLRRMSVDCDCAGTTAAEPTIRDIGIVASTDILAVDQASVDLVYNRKDNHDLVERITSRGGLHQLTAMRMSKMGNPRYEFISID